MDKIYKKNNKMKLSKGIEKNEFITQLLDLI